MPNGSQFLDELAKLIAARRQEHGRTELRLQELNREIEALETAARIYRGAHNITQTLGPEDLHGKTQVQALVTIAKASNGEFRVNDAKRLMLETGLVQNPKNAASILYMVISRNEHLFEKVSPGIYRLRDHKPATSQPRMV